MFIKSVFKVVNITAVLMLIVITPLAVVAGSEVYTEGFLEYKIVDDAIEICGYFGNGGEVVVPSSIAGYPVSKILNGAFTDSRITVLYLPDTIMEIEEGAISQGIDVVFDYHADTDGDNTSPSGSEGGVVDPVYDPQQSDAPSDADDTLIDTEIAPLNTDVHTDGSETDLDDDTSGEGRPEAKERDRKAFPVIIIIVLLAAAAVTALITVGQKKERHDRHEGGPKK